MRNKFLLLLLAFVSLNCFAHHGGPWKDPCPPNPDPFPGDYDPRN